MSASGTLFKSTEEKKPEQWKSVYVLPPAQQELHQKYRKNFTIEKLNNCRELFQKIIDTTKINLNVNTGLKLFDDWGDYLLSYTKIIHTTQPYAIKACELIDSQNSPSNRRRAEANIVFEIVEQLQKIFLELNEKKITNGAVIDALTATLKEFDLSVSSTHEEFEKIHRVLKSF